MLQKFPLNSKIACPYALEYISLHLLILAILQKCQWMFAINSAHVFMLLTYRVIGTDIDKDIADAKA